MSLGDGIPPWFSAGACCKEDGELFFPEQGGNQHDIAKAKAICAGCPIREALCVEYALELPEDTVGIFAGLTERERSNLRRRISGAIHRASAENVRHLFEVATA